MLKQDISMPSGNGEKNRFWQDMFPKGAIEAALSHKSCSEGSPHDPSVIAGVHEQMDENASGILHHVAAGLSGCR
jgi:hypothetical protein